MLLLGLLLVALIAGARLALLAPKFYEKNVNAMRTALYFLGVVAMIGFVGVYVLQGAWSIPLITWAVPCFIIAAGLLMGGGLSRKLFVTV